MIGVTWRRGAEFVREGGLDSSFVTPWFLRNALVANGLRVRRIEEFPLPPGDAYDAVLVWAGEAAQDSASTHGPAVPG